MLRMLVGKQPAPAIDGGFIYYGRIDTDFDKIAQKPALKLHIHFPYKHELVGDKIKGSIVTQDLPDTYSIPLRTLGTEVLVEYDTRPTRLSAHLRSPAKGQILAVISTLPPALYN